MIEVRIHGRGGQGSVVASLIFANAAHAEKYEVQAFPEFGVERRGAPVTAFARLDRKPIKIRTKIYQPNFVMVLDSALMKFIDVSEGLDPRGVMLLNTAAEAPDAKKGPWRTAVVDATAIAASCGIGTTTSPIVNTTMVGAFAKVSGLVSIDSVCNAIRDLIPAKAEKNIEAARLAYKMVRFVE